MAVSVRPKRQESTLGLRQQLPESLWRITVSQYHEMIRAGILTADDPVELIEGWLFRKMSKNPPHTVASRRLRRCLTPLLPDNLDLISQDPISLERFDSEPEPDFAIVSFDSSNSADGHPTAKDTQLVIEVSHTTLGNDLTDKKALYAKAGIPVYWVVNLVDSQIEVFTQPSRSAKVPTYRTHQVFRAPQKVPVVLNGKRAGFVLVADVLP